MLQKVNDCEMSSCEASSCEASTCELNTCEVNTCELSSCEVNTCDASSHESSTWHNTNTQLMIVRMCVVWCLDSVQLPTPANLPACAYGQWESNVINLMAMAACRAALYTFGADQWPVDLRVATMST